MAIESHSYPAFNTYPAITNTVGPTRRIDDLTRNVRVLLSGSSFTVQVQISNAPITGYEHMFRVPEESWETKATVSSADPPVDVQQPVRWLRLVVTAGSVNGGSIAETSSAESPGSGEIRDAAQAAASAQSAVTALANSLTRVQIKTPGTLPTLTANTAYQLGAGTYTIASQTLPDGVTLEGIPGQTVLVPPTGVLPITGFNGRWLYVAAGTKFVMRDIIMDAQDHADLHYGVLCAGTFDFTGGGCRNMLGDTVSGAFFLTQVDPSDHFTVTDATFDNIRTYEDGAESNSIGAARALYLNGTKGAAIRCTFNNIGGFEDGDPIHFSRALSTSDGWTSAEGGKVLDCVFNGFGKRAVKVQASDVEVRGNRITNSETDVTKSPHSAIEIFGSRCVVRDNHINLSRAMYGIISGINNAHDNKILDNTIRNGAGTTYTAARQGNSVIGIFDASMGSLIMGNDVESSATAVMIYNGATNTRLLDNPRLVGRVTQTIYYDGVNGIISGNDVSGSASDPSPIGIAYYNNATGAQVRGNTFSNTTIAHRLIGTSTGNTIGRNTYPTGVTSIFSAYLNTGTNALTDPVSYASSPADTSDAKSFDLWNPSGQLNPYLFLDSSDSLHNVAHRLNNVPVVNVTGVTGLSTFSALGLTGHNGAQGGITLNFATTTTYPIVIEVDYGSQAGPLSYGTRFYPALLAQTSIPGLTSVAFDYDIGAGYVTGNTVAVNGEKHIRSPGITIGTALKKGRWTLTGSASSGTVQLRRVMLQYPELGFSQNIHPSWEIFRTAHSSTGNHAGVTPTLDFPSIAAGATSPPLTATIGGLLVTDGFVTIPPANLPDGLVYRAYWSATSTISVKLTNITGAAIDPPSGGWVFKLVR